MRLLIIGPQASGKGTQADMLAKRLNIPHLSTGGMFRDEIRSGSALGGKLASFMDKGMLVPDDVVWKMLKAHLVEHPEGWVLDGYPRNAAQTAPLDAVAQPEKVLLLEVPDAVCLERISGRRICAACGQDYHITYKPPKREGVCDLDGGKLLHRADDYPEAVRKRLQTYHASTAPLLKHYAKRLVRINGDQGIREVWAEIKKKLRV
jgi:adenylate kinase